MSLKSKFSCLYCAKIFKDPVILPCNRNICEHYLKDAKVVKENKIVCPKCNKSFEVKILSLKWMIWWKSYWTMGHIWVMNAKTPAYHRIFDYSRRPCSWSCLLFFGNKMFELFRFFQAESGISIRWSYILLRINHLKEKWMKSHRVTSIFLIRTGKMVYIRY